MDWPSLTHTPSLASLDDRFGGYYSLCLFHHISYPPHILKSLLVIVPFMVIA
jgi:hypothetical protein